MGNFDGRGDSLNLKSDKGGEPSSLISRIKHQPKTSTQRIRKYAKPKNYKKLEERTINNLTERLLSPMVEWSMQRILDEE